MSTTPVRRRRNYCRYCNRRLAGLSWCASCREKHQRTSKAKVSLGINRDRLRERPPWVEERIQLYAERAARGVELFQEEER